MLISTTSSWSRRTGEPFGPALVLRGARERLAPIVTTALATGLALLPLVVLGTGAGQRDRASDGGGDPGRAGHRDPGQPVRRSLPLPAVRAQRASRRRQTPRMDCRPGRQPGGETND